MRRLSGSSRSPVGEVPFPLPAQPRDPMRGNTVEETTGEIEAPQVLQAVEQPVGIGGVAARFELPDPHEPRHAVIDRFVEQILKITAKSGWKPIGDADFDPAFRFDESIGAKPLDCRRRWQDHPCTSALLNESAHESLVRLRPLRLFAEPVANLARRTAREGSEPVQPAQLGEMLMPGLGSHRVVGEVVPGQVELATDEIYDGRRNELARGQQAARVAERAELQRETQLVARAPPRPDVEQIFIAQGVVTQQVRLALRKGKQGRPLSARQNHSPSHISLSSSVCNT